MAFRIPTNRVELLRVLSAKADVSQTKAAAVWDAMLALARDGVRQSGSFSSPGRGKTEPVERKPRRAYNLATGRRVRLAAKTDLVFRVSKLAKSAMLPAPPPPAAPAARKHAPKAKARTAPPKTTPVRPSKRRPR